MKKNNRGGARSGAGRKLKYGEATIRVTFQIPKSREDHFRKIMLRELKKFEVS